MPVPKTGVMAMTGPLTSPVTKQPTTAEGAKAKRFRMRTLTPCGAGGSSVNVAAASVESDVIVPLTNVCNSGRGQAEADDQIPSYRKLTNPTLARELPKVRRTHARSGTEKSAGTSSDLIVLDDDDV